MYGLLVARTLQPHLQMQLHLVNADATLAATVPIEDWTQVAVTCSPTIPLDAVPPVSASDGHVYLREGPKIRMVVPPAGKVDVTTVPNSSSVVSFFSVSPDDQRIAVVAVDTSSTSAITTRIYVEDLFGGGHHADIYSSSAAKSGNPSTLWPMGWHKGNLVLAVAPACVSGFAAAPPTEWHVSSAVTAIRIATIKATGCTMTVLPSPAGVACTTDSGSTTIFGWSGATIGIRQTGLPSTGLTSLGLSPAGRSIYLSAADTRIVQLGPGPYATVQGHGACSWIDEDHLLSTDAVIHFPAETRGNVQVAATVTPLPQIAMPDPSTPQTSMCAGRFPGGL